MYVKCSKSIQSFQNKKCSLKLHFEVLSNVLRSLPRNVFTQFEIVQSISSHFSEVKTSKRNLFKKWFFRFWSVCKSSILKENENLATFDHVFQIHPSTNNIIIVVWRCDRLHPLFLLLLPRSQFLWYLPSSCLLSLHQNLITFTKVWWKSGSN